MTLPLLITVDVEGIVDEDDFSSVEVLADLLDGLQLPSTLFVTPEVIKRRPSTVSNWIAGKHTVGLHVHPSRLGGDSDSLGKYDKPAISSFLERGRGAFESHLGHVPTGFRAGRWSFSESLLAALAETGFQWDASFRPPTVAGPYVQHDLVEYPMSVYENLFIKRLLQSRGIDGIPLHADAFSRTTARSLLLYAATYGVVRALPEYVMISFHDYDLADPTVRERIERYVARLTEWMRPTTLSDIHQNRTSNRTDERV